MNTTQTQHTPKLNFHVAGHIKQLCDMVNSYSIQLGLGKKVRAQDFTDACAVALARDTASLVAENKRLREALEETNAALMDMHKHARGMWNELLDAGFADKALKMPCHDRNLASIEHARAALSTEGRT